MDLRTRRCLLVGGGEVAARKAELLVRAGAHLTVVAPSLTESLALLLARSEVSHCAREYEPRDLDGVALVIAASGERALDREVARDAQARQLPVNVVDDPAACSVIMPALVDRSPILIAIGSGGSAPVLSRLVRGQIEALLPQALAELGRLAAAVRGEVQQRLPDLQERRRFWEEVFEGEVAELALRGESARAEQTVRELLAARSGSDARPRGVVYLVGAGPNDPELVSLRALRCLQRADRVLWAPGVSETVVDLCRRDARRAPLAGWPLPDPDVVSQLTAATTRDGQRACVLAPGDAFRQVEGRDFADVLERAGITCVVVPGVM